MRNFKFRLHGLQKLREQARNQAQQQLAQAHQALQQQETQHASTIDALSEIEQHMRQSVNESNLNIDRMLDSHRHQISLQARLAELDEAIEEANSEVQRCREKLVEADRQVKVLEKLHDRQLAEHQQAAQAAEIKHLDEVAGQQAARRA